MLYETLLHFPILLCMLYFGLISGICFEFFNLIEKSFKQNKIICIFCDVAFMITSAVIFVFAKNITNFGEFRLYLLLPYVFGIIMLHYFVGNLVEKFLILVYNVFVKAKNKLPKFKKRKQKNANRK